MLNNYKYIGLLVGELLGLGLLLGLAIPSRANNNEWIPQGPYGGQVQALAIDPTNPAILYSSTPSGVFKSTDGGDTWTAINNGLAIFSLTGIPALTVNPITPTTLYAGTTGGPGPRGLFFWGTIYRSTDGGASWTGLFNPVFAHFQTLAINPITPTTLYAGSTGSNNVFKSTDGGANWEVSNTGLITGSTIHVLAINPITPTILYAGADAGGVFKSTDEGANWQTSRTGLPDSPVRALAINPISPTILYAGTDLGIFKSTDGGATWFPGNAGLSTPKVRALAINPISPTILYAGADLGIFKSTDGGANWALSNTGLPFLTDVQALAINPDGPTLLYAGANGEGVFKSTDSGANWTMANIGLTNQSVSALAINPAIPRILYAGTYAGGIFKSTDGGANWVASNTGLTTPSVYALIIDPSAPTSLYAGTGGGVFKSIDSGANWSAINTGLTNTDIRSLAIDPGTPNILYAGTRFGGIFKSLDSGLHWQAINAGLSNADVRALAINPATPTTLYAGTGGGVFKSTDGGAQWVHTSTGLVHGNIITLAIDPTTPTTLYAGGVGFIPSIGGGVAKSIDGGATWTPLNIQSNFSVLSFVLALAIDPTTPTTLYVGTTFDGVFKSTDGGATWVVLDTDPPSLTNVILLAVNPSSPSTVYAGTDKGTMFALNPFTIDLSLTKIVDNASPLPGQRITYTLILKNEGRLDGTQAVVSDMLPAGLTFVGPASLDPPQPEAMLAQDSNDLPILASNLTLAAGQQAAVTFPVIVNPDLSSGTSLVNTAAISSAEVIIPQTGSRGVVIPEFFDVDPGQSTTQTITTSDNLVSLTIPAGALPPNAAKLAYARLTQPSVSLPLAFAGLIFELKLVDAAGQVITHPAFTPPLLLTVHYESSLLPVSLAESELTVRSYNFDRSEWLEVANLTRDPSNDRLTFPLDHLTEFALTGPVQMNYLPLTRKN